MARFITDSDEFSRVLKRAKEVATFEPLAMEKWALCHRYFFDEIEVFSIGFDHVLKSLVEAVGDHRLMVSMLRPDPVKYFYKLFGKYPSVEFDVSEIVRDYFDVLSSDPGASLADAITYRRDEMLYYSESFDWFIYTNRDAELALLVTDRQYADINHNLKPYLLSDSEVRQRLARLPGFDSP